MKTRTPCGGCQDRTTGPDRRPCHSTCERYAAFRAAQIKETEARDKYRKTESIIRAAHNRCCTVPSRVIHGTFKERHRENGQKWPGERA